MHVCCRSNVRFGSGIRCVHVRTVETQRVMSGSLESEADAESTRERTGGSVRQSRTADACGTRSCDPTTRTIDQGNREQGDRECMSAHTGPADASSDVSIRITRAKGHEDDRDARRRLTRK